MTLLSDDAITILRELYTAPGPLERPARWPAAAWWELVSAGIARTAASPLPQARLSRRERGFEAERLLLRMRLGPEFVVATERGRRRLERIEAGRRRVG